MGYWSVPELHYGVVDEDNDVLWDDFALWGAPQNKQCSNERKLAEMDIFHEKRGAPLRDY